MRIYKANAVVKIFFLAVAISLTFSTTKYLPGFFVFSEIWTVLSCVLVCYVVLLGRFKFSLFERYVLIMILYVPIASAWAAYSVFEQPLLFGVMCMRQYFISGFSLYLIWLIRRKKIQVANVASAFSVLGWGFLVINSAAKILIDPAKFEASAGFFAEGSDKFVLDPTFIIFMFMFFSISGILKSNIRHGVYAFPFLLYYLIFDGGRFALISMLMAIVIVLFLYGRGLKVVGHLLKAVVAILILLVVAFYVYPEKIDLLFEKYIDAFQVLATGKEGSDSSANSRLLQMEVAVPYIISSPFFGNGMLSSQWNEGFSGVFGYFHPSDNGLTGVVFVFGIVGLALFCAQYAFALSVSRRLRLFKFLDSEENFIRAVQCYLIYIFIFSFTSGRLAFGFESSVFLIAVLYGMYLVKKQGGKIEGHGRGYL